MSTRLSILITVCGLALLAAAGPVLAGDGEADEASDAAGDLAAFERSGFQACDAEVLAEVWGVDLDAARARIGEEVSEGREAGLREVLGPLHARRRAAGTYCFASAQLSFAELEVLAREHWGVSVDEASRRADELLAGGGDAADELRHIASQYLPNPPSQP